MPVAGVQHSDLMQAAGFKLVTCPYSGEQWAAIPAIAPDWAIIHVQEADADGNCRIAGPRYDDLLLARAAAHVLVTAERIVAGATFAAAPERTDLPGLLVTAVVEAPRGAWPHACHGEYAAADDFFAAYLAAAAAGEGERSAYVQRVLHSDGVAP